MELLATDIVDFQLLHRLKKLLHKLMEIKKISEEQFNAKILPQISKPVPKLILDE